MVVWTARPFDPAGSASTELYSDVVSHSLAPSSADYIAHMVRPIAGHNAILNGHRIAYGEVGPSSGPAVILIHGTPSSSLIWRNIISGLVEAGFRAVYFDLLGFGESERPWSTKVDTSMTGQVDVLVALIRHLGLSTAHVVAHDIGGGVAQRFCILRPLGEQFNILSLTLINSVSFDSFPSKRIRKELAAGPDRLAKADPADHEAFFRPWFRSAVASPDRIIARDDILETYLAYVSGPIGQPSFVQHQMRQYSDKHTAEVAPRYGELAGLPTQLIWGEQDGWQTVDWAHKLNGAIPNSQLHLIPDAGHFSLEDRPDVIVQLLTSFLTSPANA